MKILTRIIALLLIFSLSFGGFTLSAEESTASPPPQSDWDYIGRLHQIIRDLERDLADAENNPAQNPNPRRPVIQVTNPPIIEIEAGSSRTVEFTIANLTNHTASNVITTINSTGNPGIVGSFADRGNNIASMGNRAQRTFSMQISVSEGVNDGFYTLEFNHEHLNTYNESHEDVSRITIRVINRDDGRMSLRNIASSVSQVPPGSDFDITAVIHNEGNTVMRNVSLTITDGMASDGIFLRDSTNIVNTATMEAGQTENISIGFRADSRARRGAYPLTLQLAYTDSRGERQTQNHVFFVNVGAGARDDGASEVIITNISAPSGNIGVGQEFQMTVTLRNQSAYPARNIRVDASASDGAVVPRSTSILQINTLEPGAEQNLNFRFAPTNSARSQNYAIGFTVRYETGREDADGNDEVITFTQYQGVNVTNPERDDDDDDPVRTSTPRIIVSDFRSSPMIVQAGHEFDLEVEFLNTSDRVVRNIMITLSVEDEITAGQGNERRGSVFTPVGRSNTFFINRIEPGGTVTEHIRYFTLPDAPPRNYVINVLFEYEDEDNHPFEARGAIGINVAQVTRFDTTEIFVPDFAMAFQPIFINFEIFNTGRVTMSNLMIRVEGDFSSQQSTVFFGNLNPGAMDFYDNVLTPMGEGLVEGAIVISFEDDTGQQIEERREFSVEVAPMPVWDDDMMGVDRFPMDDMVWDDRLGMFVPANQGLGTLAMIGIALGGIAVVGAAAFVGLRIRKKKKMESMVDIDE